MRMKRTTGLVLSLALLMAPATAALAKPVATHHVDVIWSASNGDIVNGGFTLEVDEAGIATVDFVETTLTFETCGTGLPAMMTRDSLQFSGESALKTVIDRQLKTIEVSGTLHAERTVTSGCDGASVTSSEVIDVTLVGVSIDRPVRTRDQATGVRRISVPHQIALDFGGGVVTSTELLTKSIARA